ncbi:hypothetical protein J3459_021637 [Metarhizium acridum]|nr:hypothetical protein J3459_021637 [Metarhizium acridum]
MSEPVQTGSWDFGHLFVPRSSSFVIRSISALCAFIGTIFILPLFFFLAIDISLWVWRHLSSRNEPQNSESTSLSSSTMKTSATSSTSVTTPDAQRTRKR